MHQVPAAASCRVPGWAVFGPGYHKGTLYTTADCRRMVENFQLLSAGDAPYLKAKAKLGHDDEQRLANSLGYPSCGTITGARLTDDGMLSIDVDDVPLAVGSEINAGRINDGSVELDDEGQDANGNPILGPILTGVAFLGEEQPAVKGCPPPKAVLADGGVVPQGEKAAPWLSDLFRKWMSAARPTKTFSVGGRQVTRRVVRFSEALPMPNADALTQMEDRARSMTVQALVALGIDVTDPVFDTMTTDQLNALLVQLQSDPFLAWVAATFGPPSASADARGKDMLMSAARRSFDQARQATNSFRRQFSAADEDAEFMRKAMASFRPGRRPTKLAAKPASKPTAAKFSASITDGVVTDRYEMRRILGATPLGRKMLADGVLA